VKQVIDTVKADIVDSKGFMYQLKTITVFDEQLKAETHPYI